MDKVYVQSIAIKMVLKNGKEVTGRFMGLAICSPAEWGEMTNDNIYDHLAEKDCLLFSEPVPLEKAIAGREDYNDIIDVVREELRKDHHEDLTND